MMNLKPLPFEVSFAEVQDNLGSCVETVFDALESDFLVMPRGEGFVDQEAFSSGYRALYDATGGFGSLDSEHIYAVVCKSPLALVVFRSILGFTPPEWADAASMASDVDVTQGYARNLDRSIRKDPSRPIGTTVLQEQRIRALVLAACELLGKPPPDVEENEIHRLHKVDTQHGLESVRQAAESGVPYEALLYERYLGRPFASHRDSVSELVGDLLEDKIESELNEAGVEFYRTKRAERIEGYPQAPDFFCPDYEIPLAMIEAKLTQDDGTARDKVARVLRLAADRDERERRGDPSFEVIACISGRGFGVRASDMEDLLVATRGKVFTLSQIDRVVDCTRLSELQKNSKQ